MHVLPLNGKNQACSVSDTWQKIPPTQTNWKRSNSVEKKIGPIGVWMENKPRDTALQDEHPSPTQQQLDSSSGLSVDWVIALRPSTWKRALQTYTEAQIINLSMLITEVINQAYNRNKANK